MIREVTVIGSGTMGTGIAYVIARSGCKVILSDKDPIQLNKSRARILQVAAKDKDASFDTEEILNNIRFHNSLSLSSQTDIVIEAVFEDLNIKKDLFREVNKLPEEIIVATNTSGYSITELGSVVKNPGRFIGTHFFNPVEKMPLVEIIKGLQTNEETEQVMYEFMKGLGKTPILVPKDSPGFIVNRILLPMINEAVQLYDEGVSPKSIDAAMKLGAGFPMGPLALLDLIGLDVFLNTSEYFVNEFKNGKYGVPIVLRQMVRAGYLGRKTGKGFYEYK